MAGSGLGVDGFPLGLGTEDTGAGGGGGSTSDARVSAALLLADWIPDPEARVSTEKALVDWVPDPEARVSSQMALTDWVPDPEVRLSDLMVLVQFTSAVNPGGGDAMINWVDNLRAGALSSGHGAPTDPPEHNTDWAVYLDKDTGARWVWDTIEWTQIANAAFGPITIGTVNQGDAGGDPWQVLDKTKASAYANASVTDTPVAVSGDVPASLAGIEVINPNAAVYYLRLFNHVLSGVSLVGSTQVLTLLIPAAAGGVPGVLSRQLGTKLGFSVAITAAITTTASGAGATTAGCVLSAQITTP